MIDRQTPRNQTLYADLLQEVLSATSPSGRGLSFTRKTIKGRIYWYLSVAVGNRRLQSYLGADTQLLRESIDRIRAQWTRDVGPRKDRARLVAHLISTGAVATLPSVGTVLSLLADGGVFRAGTVLVGTHAFQAYANLLGVRWASGAMRTQDIDLAVDRIALAVKLEGVHLTETLDQAGGFSAIPSLLWKHPSSSFSGAGLHIDILTPLLGKPGQGPVFVERLGVHAEPLRFLDYLMVDAQPCVLLAKDGIPVNVPDLARFALHKLVVSERRQSAWATKAYKDVQQAAAILEVLAEDMPGALIAALDAARRYHGKFRATVLRGARRLPEPIRNHLRKLDAERPAEDPVAGADAPP